MIVLRNRGYKKKYVYGGSGIFEPIAKTLANLFSKETAKQIASKAASKVIDVGKAAAQSAAESAKDIATKAATTAVDVGKTAVQTAAERGVQKIMKKIGGPPTRLKGRPALTPQSHTKLKQMVHRTPVQQVPQVNNINSLIDGSAIPIQDLIRKIKGQGMKMV